VDTQLHSRTAKAVKRRFYDLVYRHFHAPWDIGVRTELTEIVEAGRIQPCRAIDLGCGTGSNAIYLAKHGFDVTGVDFAPSAIDQARAKAAAAGVRVHFIVDDLTNLRRVAGSFEFLLDYGVLDDLTRKDRDRYVRTVLRLSRPGSRYMLWCFEWPARWWERPVHGLMALHPGEVERRFSRDFLIERLAAGGPDFAKFPPGFAAYLMTRNNAETPTWVTSG
jgi:SAM-dependent methyltransferase